MTAAGRAVPLEQELGELLDDLGTEPVPTR
jgi:hypothetical protein